MKALRIILTLFATVVITGCAAIMSLLFGSILASFFEPLTDDQYYQITIWTAIGVMIIFIAAVLRLLYKTKRN